MTNSYTGEISTNIRVAENIMFKNTQWFSQKYFRAVIPKISKNQVQQNEN